MSHARSIHTKGSFLPQKRPLEEEEDEEECTFTENGAKAVAQHQVGDYRVALFSTLVRNLPVELFSELFANAMKESHESPEYLADLFVLAFQTRNCRGGKGEKVLFYLFFFHLYTQFPQTVRALLPLIPKFGYFKDLFNMLEDTPDELADLQMDILRLIATQLQQDWLHLFNNNVSEISLCAKYAPREGKHFAKGQNKVHFQTLVQMLFPDNAFPKAAYRKMISQLSVSLNITESKMTAQRYADIDFKKVTSICLFKNRKAFANETSRRSLDAYEETGNRFPENADRIACRRNLKAALTKDGVVIKSTQLYPHDIVRELYKGSVSESEKALFEKQWQGIRENVVLGSLDKLVPLVDVSGSMEGDPMHAAIALGILISEINHPAFRDRFLSFETDSRWVNLSDCSSFYEKVQLAKHSPWGGSTNLLNAFDKILEVVEKARLSVSEIPGMIIFSDMQFDMATLDYNYMTTYEIICKRFAEVGVRISGEPYPCPRIIFWNLRSTKTLPVKAYTPNVQMLSGFSPSLLELVMKGDLNPYTTFRAAMDKGEYDVIREILSLSDEGRLKSYKFP